MKLNKINLALSQMLFLTTCVLTPGYAETVEVIGEVNHQLQLSNRYSQQKQEIMNDIDKIKVIKLLKVKLSDEEKASLHAQAKDALTHSHQFALSIPKANRSEWPGSVQLEMNEVPVLDQGIHGTCVTFAITGAIDAVVGKGDYLSQLCNLQLGTYLEKHGYGSSGWNGSHPIQVINQIEQYGAVSMQQQSAQGCGGLTSYPTYYQHNPESMMEPDQFSAMSEPIFGHVANWSEAMNRADSVSTLNNVKEALNSGDRLVFAVLFPRVDLGTAGAVGKHRTWFYKDTWLLTPEILAGVDHIEVAHEMIITGYDDHAVAVDDQGKKHTGLLKLRNSWGSSVGDWGEFYMSYDYFKLLAFDVKRISKPTI